MLESCPKGKHVPTKKCWAAGNNDTVLNTASKGPLCQCHGLLVSGKMFKCSLYVFFVRSAFCVTMNISWSVESSQFFPPLPLQCQLRHTHSCWRVWMLRPSARKERSQKLTGCTTGNMGPEIHSEEALFNFLL